jgi:hypothetical protein
VGLVLAHKYQVHLSRRKLLVVYLFQTTSRKCLLSYVLFAILLTLVACPQSVSATPQRHSLPSHSLTPLKNTISHYLNWAGYRASAGSKQGVFPEANMYFTVPKLKTTPGKATRVSIWAGVGGAPASPHELVQAGVESKIDSSGTQINTAWWEVIGGGKSVNQQSMKLQVNAGDPMWVYVGSNVNHNGNRGYDGFLVENLKTGISATHYEHAPNTFSDGVTAECIVERSTSSVTNKYFLLANFQKVSITGCGVYASTQSQYGMVPIGRFAPTQYDMVDNKGGILAHTSSLQDGANFDVTWQKTGDGS